MALPSRVARRRPWISALLAAALAAAVAGSAFYGQRTYRTFLLLQSAQALGVAEVSSIRGWMTLDYLAGSYDLDASRLRSALGLTPDVPGTTTLRMLAGQRGAAVFDTVGEVQKTVALLIGRDTAPAAPQEETGWFDSLTQAVMAGVLAYGYPALLVAVFLGSLGLPVPAGAVTAFAGSLAASGQVAGLMAFAIAMLGSLIGDAVAYAIGRAVSPAWLMRRGGFLGYTEANRVRALALFERWGSATVVIGMSVVSHFSSVVGLLAGLSHWSLARYLAAAIAGRLVWTLGYFGLGYAAGSNFAAASGFLFNLGMTAVCGLAAAGLIGMWSRLYRIPGARA
jgi:membrane protein DedA with SNARE-associated domain